jgi:hypothetical protein
MDVKVIAAFNRAQEQGLVVKFEDIFAELEKTNNLENLVDAICENTALVQKIADAIAALD